ncbi:Mycoplasma haemagglutinin, partial [Mycoplasmoides gallisepticum]
MIGGNANRSTSGLSNVKTSPDVNGDRRTFTIYVNAPMNGEYSISGSYLTNNDRNLVLSTSNTESSSNHTVTITVKGKNNW